MEDNFSLTQLFITKKIMIFVDDKNYITVNAPTIKQIMQNLRWGEFYNLIRKDITDIKTEFKIKVSTRWEFIWKILHDWGQYEEIRPIYNLILEQLPVLMDKVDLEHLSEGVIVNDVNINDEIWDYVVYILQLCYGEKIEKPRVFSSEAEKQFYMAQKAYEAKINKIKQQQQEQSVDSLGKSMLSIVYSFPSFTIDYLINQTLAQIQWLQKYAAGALSYEVNQKIYAAGNMKKGSKLEFFIK